MGFLPVLPSECFPSSNRKPQGSPQAAPKPRAHSTEHQPPSMDVHPLPKGGSLLSTRASCSQPTAAGALLSTKVPKLQVPCFHPHFFFLDQPGSGAAALISAEGHSIGTTTTPRSTVRLYPSPPHQGGSGSRGFVYTEAFNQHLECFLPQEVTTESRFYGLRGMGEN